MTVRPKESVEDAIRISFPKDAQEDATLPKPVIYLFGWAGASDEKMAQFSHMYTSKGYTCVTYTGTIITYIALQYLCLFSSSC